MSAVVVVLPWLVKQRAPRPLHAQFAPQDKLTGRCGRRAGNGQRRTARYIEKVYRYAELNLGACGYGICYAGRRPGPMGPGQQHQRLRVRPFLLRTADVPTWNRGNRANQVWSKSDLARQEGPSFPRVIALNVVNCPDRNLKALSIRAYCRDGSNEELPTDPDRTISLTPDSVIASVADVVCRAPQAQ